MNPNLGYQKPRRAERWPGLARTNGENFHDLAQEQNDVSRRFNREPARACRLAFRWPDFCRLAFAVVQEPTSSDGGSPKASRAKLNLTPSGCRALNSSKSGLERKEITDNKLPSGTLTHIDQACTGKRLQESHAQKKGRRRINYSSHSVLHELSPSHCNHKCKQNSVSSDAADGCPVAAPGVVSGCSTPCVSQAGIPRQRRGMDRRDDVAATRRTRRDPSRIPKIR